VVIVGSGSASSGLSESDKIALGCGISIPMAMLLIAIYLCIKKIRKDRLAKTLTQAQGMSNIVLKGRGIPLSFAP
jgi:hypothetical protein